VTTTVAERYLRLGLQLGRHDEGIVDAYFGPAELAAQIAVAPPVPPATLVADAEALLGELDDSWLRDQVAGLRTFAGVLAGESYSYADEVEGCYGVRPVHTGEGGFAEAHEQLAGLLPGSGPLDERYQSWRDSILVPADQVEAAVAAVIAEARSQTRELIDLPAGEGLVLELAEDESWMAYNFYLGDLRGRVAVNISLPMSAIELLHLAIHETYPGHQAERAMKEHLLVRGQAKIEESLVLTPTPQSLIAEGIGELAPKLLLGGAGAAEFGGLIHKAGLKFDLAQALAIERARSKCQWAMVNAALMLHESGASEAEAQSYLERWGLLNAGQAGHAVRFLTEPTSRTYATVYPAGLALCQGYVAGDPARFRRLLTEQVRVRDLTPPEGR
jgi:hypothetical protein